MDLIDAMRVLARRWILTGLLLCVSLAGAAAALFLLPWTYQAQSTVVLLPSRNSSEPNGYNPYLSFQSSLTQTAYIVSVAVMAPPSALKLADAGDSASYTVALSPNTDGPVLVVTVTGHSKAVTEQTLLGVDAAIAGQVGQSQAAAGITRNNRISVQVESVSTHATLLLSKKAKTVGLVAALGIFLTLGIPLFTDGLRQRRMQESLAGRQRAESSHMAAHPVSARDKTWSTSGPYLRGSDRGRPDGERTAGASWQASDERGPGVSRVTQGRPE